MSARFGTLVILLSVASCGSSPKTHFYTLDPVPAADTVSHALTGRPLEVGPVGLPATLDRQSMVRQGAGAQLDISDQSRWAAPLNELSRRALTSDLRDRLPPGMVLAPGDPTPPGTRTLTVNVQRFIADASDDVVLEVDWSSGRSGHASAPHHERIQVPVSGKGAQGVADAMSRALGELADRVVSGA